MSNVEGRPYAGTWVLNNRSVVKYTPDALVFINGDTSLPGCARCRGRIEVQKFVTGLSVEAGTSPTSHSATIQLALPRVQGKQVFIDGYNILRAGLEIHIFLRGYFPMRGMFSHLANSQAGPDADSNNFDLTKYATYPYYPAFHGLITQVSYEYSNGFYYGTLNCTSLLHFWQFVNITTAGAWMAQDKRPTQDLGRTTLYGHNFNNVHPFSIIYTLYRDVAGSAAGVDFALKDESNLDAVSASMGNGGRQIFSTVATYWEQRFKTRIQNLRMYGVNGQLFNGVQQAWLGKNRDVKGLLTSSTANDPATTDTAKDPFSARYSVAKSLGLQGAGADFTFSPMIQQDNEFFNISVLDMFAFNQTVGEMGAGDVWQSTYQTKMDIAQQVMKITGFEFYQDVDGDLVFKPPFWNLDTAPNRYYRLEDSDIINITFVEKEPNATYIIVRGVWIAGLKDVAPADGVLTKRGLYIDYKLVAQFGWRPAPTLELTYVLDPKVLFWVGIARLDMLNVDTFSATATIPIRAELRPGFPVYIPFADSYYYINQLSHSFAFGGQCTTSLVLSCRRAKWHAPGFLKAPSRGHSVIEHIRLDRPDLPPRPLETFVNGISRLVGFPNVVMALDPRKINPNFSVVGIGLDYFDSVQAPADLLFGWIARDVHLLGSFEIVNPVPGPDGNAVYQDPTLITKLKMRTASNETIEFTLEDLQKGFKHLSGVRDPVLSAENAVRLQEEAVASADQQLNVSAGSLEGSSRAVETGQLDILKGKQQSALKKYRETLSESPSIATLVKIFKALQPNNNEPIRRKIDGIPGSDVRLSYFESLSHLKGQYMAGTVPGNYRYFSCSHPFESQQGMPIIQWDDGEKTEVTTRRSRSRGRRQQSRIDTTPLVPDTGNRKQRNRDEKSVLQDRLDERGVTWVSASNYLSNRDKGVSWNNGKISGSEEVKNTPLSEGVADNLVNLGVVTQELFDRLARRSDFGGEGFRLRTSGKSWAVGATVEASDDASQHAQGKAQDTGVVTPDGRLTNEKFEILLEEAGGMWAEGWFGGLGSYLREEGAKRKSFVHIDIRSGEHHWGDFKDKKGLRVTDKSKSSSAVRDRLKAEKQAAFAKAGGIHSRTRTNPDLWEEKAPTPSTNPDSTETSTAVQPVPTEPNPTNVLKKPPSVNTRDLSLNVSRTVVQFKPTTKTPAGNYRAPEVTLGIGKCRKGLQLAVGPNRTPQVVTTDQIQRISFVRHQAGKFTQVVGTSQNSGSVSFKAISLQKQINDIFRALAPDDPSVTVRSIYQEPYTEMRHQLGSVDIPIYDGVEGNLVVDAENNNILLKPFDDVLIVDASDVPESLQQTLNAQFTEGEEGLSAFFIGDLTFEQLSQVTGYSSGGDPQGDGQSWYVTINKYVSRLATAVVDQIENGNNLPSPDNWPGYAAVKKLAAVPKAEKQERIGDVTKAFNDATTAAFGINAAQETQTANPTEEKTVQTGKQETPIHSPVFPVSDEKGYEHYGSYRYGRGLSVEPGGTFEFIHSGKDPFKNVTAQSAEEFLNVLTLVKTGRIDDDSATLSGFRKAAFDFFADLFSQKEDPLSTEGLSPDVAAQGQAASEGATATVGAKDVVAKVGLSEFERAQVEQSVMDLASTVTSLGKTARGRDVLRELLEANGDDPDLIKGNSFDISQTQFVRNFVNFAVNFGKSPTFKTTAANAAYRLADLTAHLINRTGQACICRGSYADVEMEAYSQETFDTVDGVDTQTEKPEAAAGQAAIQAEPSYTVQQQRERGEISQEGVSEFPQTPLPGLGTEDAGTVSADNPPTTADPADLGDGVFSDLSPAQIIALEAISGLSIRELEELGTFNLVKEGILSEEDLQLLTENEAPLPSIEEI